jgi:phytoene synthase
VNPLIETLPPAQRLALAYAPRGLHDATLGLFALDAHLAALVRRTREPLLGQARLAWWRERLEEAVERRPKGDPLLGLLAAWEGHEAGLVALVDGWEHLLGSEFDAPAISAFAAGRAAGFGGLAGLASEAGATHAAAAAGERWALADLAAHLGNPEEKARTLAAAGELGRQPVALPRALRPLAVLDGLASRSLANQGALLAHGPRAALTALRLGIVGR